jgi:hypothetical protein
MSSEAANFWFNVANVVLLIGAGLVLLGTYGVFQFGNIKERFSDERISANEAKTASANADAEIAKKETAGLELRAADAEKETAGLKLRAADAELQLAKLKAPRTLTSEQQKHVAAAVHAFSGQKYCALLPTAGTDTESLWISLAAALRSAGWLRVDPPGLMVGNPPAGVAINAPPGVYIGVAPSRRGEIDPAAQALAKALNSAGIIAQAGLDTEADKDAATIRIVIGLKPL